MQREAKYSALTIPHLSTATPSAGYAGAKEQLSQAYLPSCYTTRWSRCLGVEATSFVKGTSPMLERTRGVVALAVAAVVVALADAAV